MRDNSPLIRGPKSTIGQREGKMMQEIENNAPPPVTSQNQYDAPFAVSISFPESIVIKMVDASSLHDYEFGLFVSSALLSATIGFFVAYLQSNSNDSRVFGAVTMLLGILAAAFFGWALFKRKKMTAKAKEFKLTTSKVEETRSAEII
jgi:hypothetical protein